MTESRNFGFLGPGPVESHVDHAQRFVVEGLPAPTHALDIGSGGGVPGLALAMMWSESRFSLLDSMVKRCVFLRHAVGKLGISDRVQVLEGRAEVFGQDPKHRFQYDFIASRSFGPPATTAECAAGLLVPGGHIVISEPPEKVDRWPAAGLALLNLERVATGSDDVAVLRSTGVCADQYPRRSGLPAKRPLF